MKKANSLQPSQIGKLYLSELTNMLKNSRNLEIIGMLEQNAVICYYINGNGYNISKSFEIIGIASE